MSSIPICPYCNNPAKLITGAQLYRGRPDLSNVNIWQCQPCDARVGCHTSDKMSKSAPIGTLANKALRNLRATLHEKFDQFWINSPTPNQSKVKAISWLAEQLSVPSSSCYISNFNESQCRAAIAACLDRSAFNKAKKQHKINHPGVPFQSVKTVKRQQPPTNLPF